MTWIDDFVVSYKQSVEEIEQIDGRKFDAESDLRLQMVSGLKTFDERISVIKAEQKAYEEDMQDYIASALIGYDGEKSPFLDKIREVEHFIGILNGSHLREVYRIEKDEIYVHNCKVKFFDEFFDNDCLSLRAIIVEYEGVFGLYIVGSTENGGYRYGNQSLIIHAEKWKKPLPIHVICHIEDGEDLEELIAFYNENVKEWKSVNEAMEYLNEMVTAENHIHDENVWVKEHMYLSDFEDVLGVMCYNCGNDGLSKRYMVEHRIVTPKCRHCGSDMNIMG